MPPSPLRLRVWPLALALLALAAGAHGVRRATIRRYFVDGAPDAPPPLTPPPVTAAGMTAATRVRVVLIDGLGLDTARGLATFSRACESGIDLVVDTGFPTVSLPVQHVLWTGLTQSQSGVLYRLAQLPRPPPSALPVRVPDSRAVAESHAEIASSFGFASVEGSVEAPASPWPGFARAARAAVASPARLVFVHVLAVDQAGHAFGARAPQYRAAATAADALLDDLLAADPGARWFLMSDHGHRPDGGHADAEPEIRFVRACISGGVAPSPKAAPVHLVDLHRALADALALTPAPPASGRPLAFAQAHPDRDATLPRTGPLRWLAVVALLAAAVLGSARALTPVGRAVAAWPWWLLLSYGSLVALHGPLSLSNPVVYPPLGLRMLVAALPGLLLMTVQALHLRRRLHPGRWVIAQLALPVAFCLGMGILCGGPQSLLGLLPGPPLVPLWSAHFSALLSQVTAAALALGLLLLLWRAGHADQRSAP